MKPALTAFARPSFRANAALLLAVVAACEGSALAANPKRGFGSGDAARIDAVNSSWSYNWGTTRGYARAEYVPMIWGGFAATDATINRIRDDPAVTTVLGFNEPERPDQANMSVQYALDTWPKLMQTGKRLVSPAPSDTAEGRAWLQSFMSGAAARGYQVDAVAFHWYGDVRQPGAASAFLNSVAWYHSTFNKPVWITEFGGIDWYNDPNNPVTMSKNLTFMQQVLPQLDSRSYVERYAWWNWSDETNLVVEPYPVTTTSLGDYYAGTTFATGQTFDLRGKDTGYDIYYLKGGTITDSAPTRGDTMRRLDIVTGVGTITGSGRWTIADDMLRVRSGATLRKTGGNIIGVADAAIVNDGTISIQGGTLQLEEGSRGTGLGTYRVEAGGTLSFLSADGTPNTLTNTIDMRGGTLSASGITQTISSPIVFNASSTVEAIGPLDLTGVLSGSGAISKTGNGTLRFTSRSGTTMSGLITVAAGTLHLDKAGSSVTGTSGVTVNAGAKLAGSAIISGAGIVSGDLSPGDPNTTNAGSIRFASTLALTSTARVTLDLASVESDAIAVGTAATLNGVLDLRSATGLNLNYLTPKILITAGSITGDFASVLGVEMTPDTSLAVTYTGDRVTVTATIAGDANVDGNVNFSDLVLLAQNYNSLDGIWARGDFTGDGAVNFADLVKLAQRYNMSIDAPGALAAPAALLASDWALALSMVPEPTSLLMIATASTMLGRRQRI